MRFLVYFLGLGLSIGCFSTSKSIQNEKDETLVLDSCEVFWDGFTKCFNPADDSSLTYRVTGAWAEISKEDDSFYTIQTDFYLYRKCIVNMNVSELVKRMGTPTYKKRMGSRDYYYNYVYLFKVLPDGEERVFGRGAIKVKISPDSTLSEIEALSDGSVFIW